MSAGLTNAWSGIKTAYGAGTGIGAGIGTAGSLLGGLSAFAGSPLGMLMLGQMGVGLLGKLFGGGQQPTDIGKTLIPQLQQQAAGMPTAATKAQGNYLNNQIKSAMQSTAASASRSMPSSSQFAQASPARAAQNRLQGARIEGMANIMGQSQMNAQNQLAGLYQGNQQMLYQKDMANAQSRNNVGAMLGQLMQMQKTGKLLPQDQQLVNEVRSLIFDMIGEMKQPINVSPTGNTMR